MSDFIAMILDVYTVAEYVQCMQMLQTNSSPIAVLRDPLKLQDMQ